MSDPMADLNRTQNLESTDTGEQVRGSPDAAITTRVQTNLPGAVEPVAPVSAEDERRLQLARARREREATTGEPDVLLDVPNLSVDEIELEVENLYVNVALDARLGNLLLITAGAEARIDRVKLTIKGVRAEVLLKVKLDNLAAILDRTLTTIDRNPQILEGLLRSVDKAVGTVGSVANTALQPGGVVAQTVGVLDNTLSDLTQPGGVLSQTINALGQTVQRTLDQTGNILISTLDASGKIVQQANAGNLLDLPVLDETINAAGQPIRRLRDVSGAVIEATVAPDGTIERAQVIDQGGIGAATGDPLAERA